MRDTAAFEVRKWELVGNTIVGLMDNGCNGNVIYIPLDYTPPVPRRTPQPQRPRKTPEPVAKTPEEKVPERERKKLNGNCIRP